jgi:3-oxoacyl-[acyl-carrier-protein] synthase-3
LGTDGSGYENLIVKTGGSRNRKATGLDSLDEEGHTKYDDYLYMNGGGILNFTMDVVPDLIQEVMEVNHLEKDEVDYYVFHQCNKMLLNTIRKICALPKDKFYIDMTDVGNTVSSTIPIALKDALNKQFIQTGMNVMLCGFGVGLSWGGTILQF